MGFAPPKAVAQSSTTRKSRLTIALGSATMQLEKKDSLLTQKLLMHDYLSSTKVVITEAGDVSTYPSYYPYGSSIEQTSVDVANKQYTGQKKVSDDSSIYNYNARYYNPTSALFIQPDSVRGPGRYSYVSGNPVQGTDPSGHDVCQQDKNLAFLWNALGQCGSDEGEDFMGEEGLGSVGTVMAAAEAASGGIGGVAAWIGDKVTGSTSGSESVNSAYASLSGGAAAGIFAMGMMSPDPGDGGRMGKMLARFSERKSIQYADGFAYSVDVPQGLKEGYGRFFRGVKKEAIHAEFRGPGTAEQWAAYRAHNNNRINKALIPAGHFRTRLREILPGGEKIDRLIFGLYDRHSSSQFKRLVTQVMGGQDKHYTSSYAVARDLYAEGGIVLYIDAPISQMARHYKEVLDPRVPDVYGIPFEEMERFAPKLFSAGPKILAQ